MVLRRCFDSSYSQVAKHCVGCVGIHCREENFHHIQAWRITVKFAEYRLKLQSNYIQDWRSDLVPTHLVPTHFVLTPLV